MAIPRIMCFGNGNKEDPDLKKSREIEKQLREDQKRMANEMVSIVYGCPRMKNPPKKTRRMP